jgi:hypothetical protein
MKQFILIFSTVFLFFGCTKPGQCVESTGAATSKDFDLTGFQKIIVYPGISLVVSQGPEYKVEVRTGENLIDNIEVKMTGDMLSLKDNTTCNWVREYGQTTVYVTAPNLTEIHSKTEKNIISDGLITFPNLQLIAMDLYDGYPGSGTGDYIFNVSNTNLTIINNGVSRFTITGNTNQLSISVYEGNGIIDTQNLLANNVSLYHRGSNDLTVHPISTITGDLFNIGNVLSFARPPVNTVVEHYHGRLIFN